MIAMIRKWRWLAGLPILVVFVVAFTGCSAGPISAPGIGGTGPLAVNVNNQQEGIWVNGEGKVTVTPDIANVSLGIEGQAATVSQAQSEAASAMDRVMNALTNNGTAKKDIQTQYFNISRVTRWDDNAQQEITLGYQVTNTAIAKLRDIAKVGAVIDAVALAGGDLTRVNSIDFSVDDPTAYYKEAREKAMVDAKNKGEQLASLAGMKLGKPTYISENVYYPPIPIYQGGAMMAANVPAPATPIIPGQTDITLSIQVVYEILR